MKKLKFNVTNYEVSIYPLHILGEVLVCYFRKVFGKDYLKFSIGEWKNRTNRWAAGSETPDKTAYFMLRKILRNRQFIKKAIKNIYFYCRRLTNFSEKFIKEDLKKKSDKELYKYYQEYGKRFKKMYAWAWIPNALEGRSNILSNKLENYLKAKLKKIGKKHFLGEYFSVLTTSTDDTVRQKEEKDLLKILKAKNKNALIKIHTKKYCWIPFNYEGRAWDKKYFLRKLETPANQRPDSEKTKRELRDKQTKYIKELKIDDDYLYLFKIAQEMSHIKDYRKNVLYKSYYHLDKLIREIARRLKLTPTQVRHILSPEMKKALIDREYSSRELNSRIKYSAVIVSRKRTKIFTGKDAEKIIKKHIQEEKTVAKKKEISGQSACGGQAKGAVKIIQETKDMKKMKHGDILVSEKTDPSLLPAMKKASAIITNTGGITCHAAIVSRELRIPCITGTKIATKVFKDGDLVEVDADKGVVRILKK